MLLNKIPVLDEGYVAAIDFAPSQKLYESMVDEYFGAKDSDHLKKMCTAVLVFKAPLFVQLHLAQHGLTLVSTRRSEISAFKPNAGEIGCQVHDNSKAIADDISRTTDALLINPASYKADGADSFMSQIILPISTYATFIVSGNLEAWKKFYLFKSVPAPILGYANAVQNIMKAEWKNA